MLRFFPAWYRVVLHAGDLFPKSIDILIDSSKTLARGLEQLGEGYLPGTAASPETPPSGASVGLSEAVMPILLTAPCPAQVFRERPILNANLL